MRWALAAALALATLAAVLAPSAGDPPRRESPRASPAASAFARAVTAGGRDVSDVASLIRRALRWELGFGAIRHTRP
jgi:hypothetical protein